MFSSLLITLAAVNALIEVDIEDFGAVADNVTLASQAINRALLHVSKAGGGVVHARHGNYLCGRVEMQSNVVLNIAQGSVLHGSGKAEHWLPRTFTWPSGCEHGFNPSAGPRGGLFWAESAHNFSILGGGTVDGAGSVWNTDFANRSNMFVFISCSDVLVDGLFIQNSSAWTLNPMFSKRLRFSRLHISEGNAAGRVGRHNTDGFDPYACEDADFVDSYYAGGDDCVAVKSGKQVGGRPYIDRCHHPSRRIRINNVTCAQSHGLTVGSELSGGVEDVNFSNIRLDHAAYAVRLKTKCGRGAYARDIRFDNISAGDVWTAIRIDQEYEQGPGECNASGTSIFDGVSVRNLAVSSASKAAFTVVGLKSPLSTQPPIKNVALHNISVASYREVGICVLANVTHKQVTPPFPACTNGIGPNSTASWLAKRATLIGDIFGHGPGILPTRSTPDAVKSYPDGPSGLRGLVWDMSTHFPITSTVFYIPRTVGKRSKSAFFFHHGHTNCICKSQSSSPALSAARCRPTCKSGMPTGREKSDPGYTWWDLYNVSAFIHSLGHDAFIFSMPLKGVNLGPGSNTTHLETDHWWFLQWEQQGDHPLRYFVEPIVLTANLAKAQGYDEINMAGLSGGGWSTTIAAAVDTRIKRSFPIAGSVPCAMRNPLGPIPNQTWTGNDGEDFEQSCMPHDHPIGPTRDDKPGRAAYASCNYTCMYLLAGLEPGRFQLQILHEFDTCCFSPHGRHDQMLAYEAHIRAELSGGERSSGAHGWFTCSANAHHKHEVAAQDKTLITSAMQQDLPPGSAGWQQLECDILHSKGGSCPANVEPGLPPVAQVAKLTVKAAKVVRCAEGANCTAVLQSAIDAGGDLRVEGSFTVLPIYLRSNYQTITFASGSVITAQRGAFRASYDCLFYADGVSGVSIIGYGARWVMHRADYANSSFYSKSEHRHGLSIVSCVEFSVKGLHISETGGDGVYTVYSHHVEIRDVVTDGAYRNGLSVIDAHHLLVIGCRFLRTAGTAPEAGIDIEPSRHKPGRRVLVLDNITFIDLECRQNRGTALSFSYGKLDPNVSAVTIRVENAVLEGLSGSASDLPYNVGLLFAGRTAVEPPAALGLITVTNVSIFNFAQPGLETENKLPNDVSVILRQVRFENVATAATVRWGGANVPVLLHQSHAGLIGGFYFDSCVITDSQKRPYLKCDSCDSRGGAVNVSGSISVHNPNGCEASMGTHLRNVTINVTCLPKAIAVPAPHGYASYQVSFGRVGLVGQSQTTKFWCPNNEGGLLDDGNGSLWLQVDIEGDGTPPTDCKKVVCPPTIYRSSSHGGVWEPYTGSTPPPSHRFLIQFANGTRRGFEHEVLFDPSDPLTARIPFVDFAFNTSTHEVFVLNRGVGRLSMPPDLHMQILYKTKSSLFRLQTGGAVLSDGTHLVVAEGTRNGSVWDSSFLFSTSDGGLHFGVRHIFDREPDMPKETRKGRVIPLGPSEPAITLLPDGKTLLVIARMMKATALWQTTSHDGGYTWAKMYKTDAWSVCPQLLALPNGAVLLVSGRHGIGLWVLDLATLQWSSFYNLAAAHNAALPASAPTEWHYDQDYADVRHPADEVKHQLSKAYLGMGASRCDVSLTTCTLLITYDRLANENKVPPGPSGKYDQVFTMEATISTASPVPTTRVVPAAAAEVMGEVGAFALEPVTTKFPRLQSVVALYAPPPAKIWTRLMRSALAYPRVQITAIISPEHADNNAPMAGDNIPKFLAHNKTWLDAMEMLRRSGIRIQHYLHLRNLTCYARVNSKPGVLCRSGECCLTAPGGPIVNKHRCCNSLENISAIVNASITYFPQDGIFQDNGPFLAPAADSPPELRTLAGMREFEEQAYNITQRAALPSGRLVTTNGVFDPWILEHDDRQIMFETSVPQIRPVPNGFPCERFTALVQNVPNAAAMREWVDKYVDAGYCGICLLGPTHPKVLYAELPEFWEEELAYLSNKSFELELRRQGKSSVSPSDA